jgi:hypothetical protein
LEELNEKQKEGRKRREGRQESQIGSKHGDARDIDP